MTRRQKNTLIRIMVSAGLFVAALVVSKLFPSLPWFVGLIIYLAAYLTVGWDILRKAALHCVHGRLLDENFLMVVASLGAFATGEYAEAVAVMLFYQVGELFQSVAVGRSRRSIAALMDIRPDHANVEQNGELVEVDPDGVSVGDMIVVKPGERIPLDGVVVEGATTLDTAALTGESVPRRAAAGDQVFSGCVNVDGLIRVRVEKPYGESTVAKILALVENSSAKKAKAENFITRFARVYTPVVVAAAVLLAVLPPLILHGDRAVWKDWIHRALTFLVISCPCALVISVPLSFFGGIGGASRRGILVKGGNYMEALARVGTVVFDKTGTLTQGVFQVTALHPVGVAESELLQIAAAAEQYSDHPIARSVMQAFNADTPLPKPDSVEEIAGKGVRAVIDGSEILVGREALLVNAGILWESPDAAGTVIHVAKAKTYLGYILISDALKPGSESAIRSMKENGIRTVMLTGDANSVAESVGSQLGMDEIHAELLPADKVSRVEALLNENTKNRTLAFVGDGINDAPVLMRADVGVAMGGVGSDAAIEAADIVLMDDDPCKLVTAIGLSRRTLRIVKENIVFCLGVKLAVLILGACGLAGMWLAVFADVGVAVIAILNAMRALRVSRK